MIEGLIFFGKHDSQDADRLGRIGRIFTAVHHVQGVVVDLPEYFLPVVFEGTEIMLSMRIVVFRETIEITNFR